MLRKLRRVKTVLVVNPAAGGGEVQRRWRQYNASISRALGPAEVRLTLGPGHATELTRSSIAAGFERLVVVGGDGTFNECINGLFDPSGEHFLGARLSMVLYPAGFGGDFARGLGLRAQHLTDPLHGATELQIDVGRLDFCGHDGRPQHRHFVNIASFGASGQIVRRVARSSKWLGGRLGFWAASARTLLRYRPQPVRLQVDDGPTVERCINTVAVANGSYFGGGMQIAPAARLNDGLLDIVCVEHIDLGGFLRHSHALYHGQVERVPGVHSQRGRRLRAEPLGPDDVLLDVDGEQPGRLPATFTVVPHRLRLYAPWERLQARTV